MTPSCLYYPNHIFHLDNVDEILFSSRSSRWKFTVKFSNYTSLGYSLDVIRSGTEPALTVQDFDSCAWNVRPFGTLPHYYGLPVRYLSLKKDVGACTPGMYVLQLQNKSTFILLKPVHSRYITARYKYSQASLYHRLWKGFYISCAIHSCKNVSYFF